MTCFRKKSIIISWTRRSRILADIFPFFAVFPFVEHEFFGISQAYLTDTGHLVRNPAMLSIRPPAPKKIYLGVLSKEIFLQAGGHTLWITNVQQTLLGHIVMFSLEKWGEYSQCNFDLSMFKILLAT